MIDDLDVRISGMKARLDGVESAIERLQEYQEELQLQIAAAQGHRANGSTAELIHGLHIRTVEPIDAEFVDRPRRGRPPGRLIGVKAKQKRAAQAAGARKRWNKMTARQRKEHLAKMQKGRKVARKAVVKKAAAASKAAA